jgi:TrmH RNA methyltransferase
VSRPARRPKSPPPRHRDEFIRIGGLAAVSALFARSPERIERLFFTAGRQRDADQFCRAMAQARKPFRQVDDEELARVAGTKLHGGIAAVARPRPVLAFDPAAARNWGKGAPLLLILDGIGNPHNLGAIARTAAFFGLDRMVISDHPAQAGLSDAAHRVAEGGLEFIQLYKASRLATGLQQLKPAYEVVGTALERGQALPKLSLTKPIALVLGNEEHGLDRATLSVCDKIVTLPGSGWVQSLNVASTAAILIHALRSSRSFA